jgi:hypothetical protein
VDIERGIASWPLVLALPSWGTKTITKDRLVKTVSNTCHFTRFFIEMKLLIYPIIDCTDFSLSSVHAGGLHPYECVINADDAN